jgi:RND superfamily putative drug exporter
MTLMGRWNWWSPAPLRRLHTRFGLREEPVVVPAAETAARAANPDARTRV